MAVASQRKRRTQRTKREQGKKGLGWDEDEGREVISSKGGLARGTGSHRGKGRGGGDDAGDDDDTARGKISEKKGDDSHGEDAPQDAPRPLLAVPKRGHVPVGTTRKLWSGPTYMSLQIPRMCGLITYNK